MAPEGGTAWLPRYAWLAINMFGSINIKTDDFLTNVNEIPCWLRRYVL